MDVVQKTAGRNLVSGEGAKNRNLADPGAVTDVQIRQFKDILQGADESPSPQNQALPANQSRPVNDGLKNDNVERDLQSTEVSKIEMKSDGSATTSVLLTEPVQVGSQGPQHSSREQPSRELSKASGETGSTRIGAAQLLESKAPESITKHSDPSNFPEKTPSVEGKHTDTDLRAAHRADQGAFIPWPSAPSQTSLPISDTRMPIGLPEDMSNMSDLDSMLENVRRQTDIRSALHSNERLFSAERVDLSASLSTHQADGKSSDTVSPEFPDALLASNTSPLSNPSAVFDSSSTQSIAPAMNQDDFMALLGRHVDQFLASDKAMNTANNGQVMLRLNDASLAGASLLLTRTEQGWSLKTTSKRQDIIAIMEKSSAKLVAQFANAGLGQLDLDLEQEF